ncbi:hypothetical protein FZC35_01375 [Candidatus Cytomitobacter indipagum]|uniref:ATP synthase YMF19-like N-terminal domain-containing protein n=1 Tax=Candidatus Cytomitobacter indipagum TaxID=2601575 RepID=A0A5C0UG55_9PROT|nr:hypothetical protein [Candidatus Cytomitobacter indipagum]QEK38024.1 hypothetical protein FZC35_01375 [Candidatus Cytomitobacter indipagum]
MLLKLLYESISFLIACLILRKFALPTLKNFVKQYRENIIDEIQTLEENLRSKEEILKKICNDQIITKEKYDNFIENIGEQLNIHRIGASSKCAKIIDKHNEQMHENLIKEEKRYQARVYKSAINVIKEEIIKELKVSNQISVNSINQLHKINFQDYFN